MRVSESSLQCTSIKVYIVQYSTVQCTTYIHSTFFQAVRVSESSLQYSVCTIIDTFIYIVHASSQCM